MTITLSRLAATGETAYIAKHNGNLDIIEATLNALYGALANNVTAGAAVPTGLEAIFGTTTGLLGPGYAQTTAGTTLNIATGYAWIASQKLVVKLSSPVGLNFSGQAANTYYVKLDALGTPYFDTSNSSDKLATVVWSGTAFTSVTQNMGDIWGFAEMSNMLVSAAWATTYATLKARFEALEAQTPQSNLQSVPFTNADVTLTQTQYNTRIIEATGTLTANVNAIVPDGAREWVVANKTTGAFTFTIKTAAGTGVTIASGKRAIVYSDGTNVVRVTADT